MVGISKKSKTNILYEKHPTDDNVVLKHEVLTTEIHKNKLVNQIQEHKEEANVAMAEMDKLESVPTKNRDKTLVDNKVCTIRY